MTAANGASLRTGPSKGLDREIIVLAALRHIDRAGAQGLTMRALGQDLEVAPMAVYRYVHGREDLLEAVVALLLDGVRDDLDSELARSCWQGYLQTLANSVRRIAVEHAGAFPLVATRHPAAPWLRPPLRSLELVENFLATLSGHGFTDQQTVTAYRAFSSFLLGHLLLESATRGAKTAPVEVAFDEGDAQVPHQDGLVDLSTTPKCHASDPCSARTAAPTSSRSPWRRSWTGWRWRCPSRTRTRSSRTFPSGAAGRARHVRQIVVDRPG